MRLFLLLLPVAALLAADPTVEIRTSLGSITARLFADACPVTVQTFRELADAQRETPDPASGQLAKRHFYDGLTFHRVIPGFMIQGGCPKGDGTGSPGFQFKDEINAVSLGLDKELALNGDQLHAHIAYPPMAQQFMQIYVQPRLAGTPPAERNAAINALLPSLQTITLMQFYTDIGYRYDAALPPSRRPVRGVLAMANSGANTNGSQFFIMVGDAPHLTGKHTVFGEVVAGMAVADAIAAVPRGQQDRPLQPVTIVSIRSQP